MKPLPFMVAGSGVTPTPRPVNYDGTLFDRRKKGRRAGDDEAEKFRADHKAGKHRNSMTPEERIDQDLQRAAARLKARGPQPNI